MEPNAQCTQCDAETWVPTNNNEKVQKWLRHNDVATDCAGKLRIKEAE